MKLSTLLTILKPLNARVSKDINPDTIEISEFKIDSRKINTGDCFIPLKGENTDGHNYIQNAFENGAICSLANIKHKNKCPTSTNKSCILINDNPLKALFLIAKYNRQKYIKTAIAITGTTGKTTTKYILYHLLKNHYSTFTPPGALNGDIGTSLALSNLNKPVQFGILEFGTAKFGEIKTQKQIVNPEINALISVGHAHTQFFKDINGVIKEKGTIFENSRKNVLAYPLLKYYKNKLKGTTYTFGYTPKADVFIKSVQLTPKGTKGTLVLFNNHTVTLQIPVLHKHIFENISASIAILKLAEVFTPHLLNELKTFEAPDRRGKLHCYMYKTTQIQFADYSYNANEISIKNTVDTLNALQTNIPKILYIADVLELGEHEKTQHEYFGKLLSQLTNTTLFLQGPRMQYAYKVLKSRKYPNKIFASPQQEKLISQLKDYIQQFPRVFIWAIGSNGMKTNNIVNNWSLCKKENTTKS